MAWRGVPCRVFDGILRITFVDGQTAELEDAEALLAANEWKEFRSPDFDVIKNNLKQLVHFDLRNLYDPV